jgi:hypothetical protein
MRWIGRTVAAFIAAWSVAAVPAEESEWVPAESLVREIDAEIQLPDGAFPRSEYARYYAPFTRKDLRSLVAVYIHDPQQAGVKLVKRTEMPVVLDGGCSVIRLQYDVQARKLLVIACNGRA